MASRPTRLPAIASGRLVSRRELLVSISGAAAVSSVRGSPAERVASDDGAPVRIRLYPRPVPLWAWVRYGLDGVRRDWPPPFRDALSAVEDAFEQVVAYAREGGRLEGLEVRVERGDLVRFSRTDAPRLSETVVPSLETTLEGFRDHLRERDALTGSTCHALLCWAPLNHRIGYGGTLSPNSRVGSDAEGTTGDAQTVANLGATEVWDSRAVTRNIAIHEVLHTFCSSDVAESVGGSDCDHDLGAAERVEGDDATLRVSPMATAYAGPDEIGGGTRFHGTGCYDHDQFHRHDGFEGVENWEYTTDLSEATMEAVTRYLERTISE